jgi:multiple sugar transport system ATP-binding protein
VLLGLRAEDLVEAGPTADPASVTLPAAVVAVEVTGPEARVAVLLDTAPEHGAVDPDAPLWARFDPHTAVRPGDRVEVAVDAARAHVFDPVTEQALYHPR